MLALVSYLRTIVNMCCRIGNAGFHSVVLGVSTNVCIYPAEIKRDKREEMKKQSLLDSTMESKKTEQI
jgi:hypothetical protein